MSKGSHAFYLLTISILLIMLIITINQAWTIQGQFDQMENLLNGCRNQFDEMSDLFDRSIKNFNELNAMCK